MTSTMEEDQSKPVIGYPPPPGYNQAQPSHHPTGYPPAQSSYPTPPAGITYPYAAYYNPNPNPYPPPRRRTTLLRRLIAAAIVLVVILGTITFIMWLVLRPQLPQFSLTSASVSPFNLSSSSQITANWDFAFSVRNPNKKMAIFYDRVQSSVFYRDQFLSQTSLPPFHLGKKNQTTVRARFVALSAYVGDRVVMDIAGDRAAGVVNFNVKMLAWVRFKTGAWRTRIRLMRVFCNGVRVGFSSSTGPGTMLGGSGECEVDL